MEPTEGASVSFTGTSQHGDETHVFEIRRIGYKPNRQSETLASNHSCVIYYAGDEYGPQILREIEAVSPYVRKVSDDCIEVFFTTGANTHIYQRWKLLGHTAELEIEKSIDWQDDPRMHQLPINITPVEP